MAIALNEMTEPIINLYEMAEQLDSAMDCLQKYSNTFKQNKEICEKLLLKDLYAQEHEYTDFITEINSQYISIWETTQIFFKFWAV